MIIEVDTKLITLTEQINLNQLIFLSMVLNKNQKFDQNVRKIVSLISDDEISYLINQNLITATKSSNSITYQATQKLNNFITPDVNYFDVFYDMYPVYVLRPDGTKCYLRANINKCRNLYNTYTKSGISPELINNCLKYEIDKKTREGKIGYMKTMWRWLVDHQWEEFEIEMSDKQQIDTTYGTELI